MSKQGKKKKEEEEKWTTAGGGELEEVWHVRETCVMCMARVNSGERGIKCDLCRRWHHSECQGISKKDYELLSKVDTKLKWFCARCDGKMDDISEGYRKLDQKVEVLEGELVKMKREESEKQARMDVLESEVVKMKKEEREKQDRMERLVEETRKLRAENVERWKSIMGDFQGLQVSVRSETQAALEENNRRLEVFQRETGKRQEGRLLAMREDVEEIKKKHVAPMESDQSKKERKQELEQIKQEVVNRGVEEIRKSRKQEEKVVQDMSNKIEEIEKERKKKNIIVFNLKESTEEEADNRIKEDLNKCGKIFTNELDIQDLTIEKVIRIGKKKDNGNRPLIIKLGTETDRNTVLSKAKRLRYSKEFDRVYLAKDMTEAEREKDKKLRQELNEKRNRKEDGWYVIRRGKVMRVQQEDGSGARGGGRSGEQGF